MKYSQEALEEMAQKIDLKEYAERTVEFKRRNGSTYFAICPFHNEKTPSLAVNEKENFFHCFGCGKSGNIYTWIQLTENLTFKQAVVKVANITNTGINEYVESESMNVFKELARINHEHDQDKEPERASLDFDRDYLRRYSASLPTEWVAEGIPEDTMRKYEIRIDESSNRIVYPVYDSDLKLIGVKGRTRFENYKDLKLMKYLNYYKIGQLDYFTGMKQAKDTIMETRSMIIVEGIKSVMKLDSWGYHNVVSAETSVLSEKQVELIVKMAIRDVTIAFDQDVSLQKIKDCTAMLRRYTNVFVVIDRWRYLRPKDSPCDEGPDIWRVLLERRMRL